MIGLINIERRVLGLITQKVVRTRPDRTHPPSFSSATDHPVIPSSVPVWHCDEFFILLLPLVGRERGGHMQCARSEWMACMMRIRPACHWCIIPRRYAPLLRPTRFQGPKQSRTRLPRCCKSLWSVWFLNAASTSLTAPSSLAWRMFSPSSRQSLKRNTIPCSWTRASAP